MSLVESALQKVMVISRLPPTISSVIVSTICRFSLASLGMDKEKRKHKLKPMHGLTNQ
jgi:hypothetical protein